MSEYYFKTIADYPLLSAEEEVDISKKIKYGTEKEKSDAVEKLVNSNLKLVASIAIKTCLNRPLDFMELVSIGNIKLFEMAKRFDFEAHNAKFSSYVYHPIRYAMIQEIAKRKFLVNIPTHHVFNKWRIDEFLKTNPSATNEQIALGIGISSVAVELAKKSSSISTTSDEEVFNNISDNSFNPSESFELLELSSYINKIMDEELNPRTKAMICSHLFNMESFSQVGSQHGITKQAIAWNIEKGLKKLKSRMIRDGKEFGHNFCNR